MELVIDRVTKQYKNKIAVDRISVKLQKGVYGLLGENGAGKTTLMRMICGILKPTGGTISFDGIDAKEESYRSILGYLPQDFGYYPDYTAMEFLRYIAALKGIPRSRALQRSRDLLETTGLSQVASKKIKTFSGGMKQRLGIAQALLNNPEVLILDEPTAGLDPKERVRFRNLLADYAGDKIVLLSTHIVSDIEAIADHVFIMKKGSFVTQGSVAGLTAQAQGKVWEVEAAPDEVRHWEKQTTVVNLRHEEKHVVLRIVSDEKPAQEATACEASLEDLYLYYFREQQMC